VANLKTVWNEVRNGASFKNELWFQPSGFVIWRAWDSDGRQLFEKTLRRVQGHQMMKALVKDGVETVSTLV
jgi:hypothetical protein